MVAYRFLKIGAFSDNNHHQACASAVVGERKTLLPAGTRVEWTDDLVVSANGTLRQFIGVNNRRLLVEEGELTAALP